MIKMTYAYSSLISIENLFQAWEEFKCGKRGKRDVQILERHLEDNIFDLHLKLKNKTYKHSAYKDFYVNDPKRRHIHKSIARDRVLHHLLYRYLYEIFDKKFIYDSYSCRLNKGTHRAVKRLEKFTRVVSKNYTQNCWALKLDIKQFFASVDHEILLKLIVGMVKEKEIVWLITEVIDSFSSNAGSTPFGFNPKIGIPLGNLTSQIFANIYLNELDLFIKHKIKIKHYIRYADDFLILNTKKLHLKNNLININNFLRENLKLQLHPKKIILRKLTQGIDFCGYVVLPHYILPRTKTKKRILKKVLKNNISYQAMQSYLGYFSHANSFNITQSLKTWFYLGKY